MVTDTRLNDVIEIDENIKITIKSISKNYITLLISAPKSIKIKHIKKETT